MIDIDIKKEFNIEKIYGKDKYKKYLLKYPILSNIDVLSWIQDKINQFTDKGKEASKFSITSYLNTLQAYFKNNKINIENLDEVNVEVSKLLKEDTDKRSLRVKMFIEFLLNAKEKDLKEIKRIGFNKIPSNVSIRNLIQSRIKSFYSARGAPISYGIKTETEGANRQEIKLSGDKGRNIIKKINTKLESPEYRLIMKIQTQTGLRIGDVLDKLTSGNIHIEEYEGHYYIKGFRTGKMAIVINYIFFTKELSTLFQSIYGIEDLTKLDLTTILKTKRGSPIKQADYLSRIKKVGKEIGIQENIKTHSFRKYFRTQINKCREVRGEFTEHLLGHKGNSLQGAYDVDLKNIEEYYKKWILLENLICVDCIIYDNTNKIVLKHKEEISNLNEQISLLINDKRDMQRQMDDIQSEFKNMTEIAKQSIEFAKTFENINPELSKEIQKSGKKIFKKEE